MLQRIIWILLFTLPLYAQSGSAASDYSEEVLKKMIGHMLVLGFEQESITSESTIASDIKKYELGGVILFDRFFTERTKVKNIRDPQQLKKLTTQLHGVASKPLLIAIDQEGGKVARLKTSYGFALTESAAEIGEKDDVEFARKAYSSLAQELSTNGINCDFAPVVDLSVNAQNKVIYQLGRSYGSAPEKVSRFAGIFMEALKAEGVVSVLKHFPGHGSSLGDSHEGFVDVSDSWSEIELRPYEALIREKRVDMIMTAHVFNRHLDKSYPATLSYDVNTRLLREKMGYEGVIISDDLQMKAIGKQYTLKETVTLAINSGVDMLLFGNQLGYQDTDELIEVIYQQIKDEKIGLSKIIKANQRIMTLHSKYAQHP